MESEKVGLKLNIQKTKLMASGPITSWEIDGETVSDFFFFWLQNHCRWWLPPWNSMMLAPWKKSYDKPRACIKKQRHYFPNKGLYSQSYSHVWMWELDHKDAEHQRINAFELWCWRRLLRVPWTARRSNQSILKEISREYSLEGLMLKLKIQYFGHLMQRVDSLEKTLDAGRDWGQEEKGMTENEMAGWHHQLDGHEFEWTLGVGDGQGGLACCDSWGRKESDTTERLIWSDLIMIYSWGHSQEADVTLR